MVFLLRFFVILVIRVLGFYNCYVVMWSFIFLLLGFFVSYLGRILGLGLCFFMVKIVCSFEDV